MGCSHLEVLPTHVHQTPISTVDGVTHVASFASLIDDLHISHNALGMGANIRVLLIRNSSSHSSLDVNGLELLCLAATLCFTRLCNQGNSLMCSDTKINLSKTVT